MASHTSESSPHRQLRRASNSQTNGGLTGCTCAVFEDIKWLAGESPRFPRQPSEDEQNLQLESRERVLAKIKLNSFNPKNEEDLEDWVDEAAIQVRRYRLCPTLFNEAWASVAENTARKVIESYSQGGGYEDVVRYVAKKMFPSSRYVTQLERELWTGTSWNTVLEASQWLYNQAARYVRLCERRGRELCITNTLLRETAERCLPTMVRRNMIRAGVRGRLEDLMDRAYEIEGNLLRERTEIPEPLGVMPVEEDELMDSRSVASATSNRPSGSKKCPGCGRNHYYKDCRYKKHRCVNCNVVGHIKRACPNTVEKDRHGRVVTRVTPKPGSTTINIRKDRTALDHLFTAAEVIEMFKEMTLTRSKRAKDKREQHGKGQVGKRKSNLPIKLVQATVSGGESDDDGSCVESTVEDDVGVAYLGEFGEVRSNVKIHCSLAGREVQAIADTGATVTVCGRGLAQKCGLTVTQDEKEFYGLGGKQKGRRTQPAKLKIGTRAVEVPIYVVTPKDFPLLIGVDALAELNFLVDPRRGGVQDAETGEFIGLTYEEEQTVQEKERDNVKDVVTGVDERKSEEELIADAKVCFDSLTTHLSDEMRNEWWNLFLRHRGCWLRPQGGKVSVMSASFVVEGPPIKQKLRPMNAALQEELDSQIQSLLENKIIRPSKSPWGAPPVFVRKKTGEYRMCLDYRKLNKRMKADAYPLPLIWENLQKAAGHKWYNCLDCNWGFWNIPLEESSKEYTAFITNKGSFEFNVLPFGIKNSPGECQRAVGMDIHIYLIVSFYLSV